MPNHVTTVCTVTGPASSVQRFDELHLTASVEDPKVVDFDFRAIIPMPESVEATTSGTGAAEGLLAIRGLVSSNPFASPNVEETILGVSRGAARTPDELRAWLAQHRPDSLIDGEKAARAIDEAGYRDWYDWSIANWGTKWGAYQVAVRQRSESRVVFEFQTAWSFPEPIFRKLANLYPDLVFEVVSFDEGWWFACRGSFGGANDFEHVEATDELYELVYGEPPESDDEDEPAPTGANPS